MPCYLLVPAGRRDSRGKISILCQHNRFFCDEHIAVSDEHCMHFVADEASNIT